METIRHEITANEINVLSDSHARRSVVGAGRGRHPHGEALVLCRARVRKAPRSQTARTW